MKSEDEDVINLMQRIPNYIKLMYAIYKDRAVGVSQKAILSIGIAYGISPIEFLPNIIPIVGLMDNVLIIIWCLKKAIRGMDEELVAKHLQQSGLSMELFELDRQIAKSTIKNTARGSIKLVSNGFKIVGYSALGLVQRLKRKKY